MKNKHTSSLKRSPKKPNPSTRTRDDREISRIKPKAHKVVKNTDTPEQRTEHLGNIDQVKQTHADPRPLLSKVSKPINRAPDAATSSVIKARPLYQYNPKPEYPNLARRRGWEGIVMLLVEVTEKGNVAYVNLQKSSGYKILDKSALRAVKHWLFLAGTRNNKPTTTTVLVPVHFKLEK